MEEVGWITITILVAIIVSLFMFFLRYMFKVYGPEDINFNDNPGQEDIIHDNLVYSED